MEYGRYWDEVDDPSGENYNFGRAGAKQYMGVANTRREETLLYKTATSQGLVPVSESVDPGYQFPATVYARETGSSRRMQGGITVPAKTLGHIVEERINRGLAASGIMNLPRRRKVNPVEAQARRSLYRSGLLGIGRR